MHLDKLAVNFRESTVKFRESAVNLFESAVNFGELAVDLGEAAVDLGELAVDLGELTDDVGEASLGLGFESLASALVARWSPPSGRMLLIRFAGGLSPIAVVNACANSARSVSAMAIASPPSRSYRLPGRAVDARGLCRSPRRTSS